MSTDVNHLDFQTDSVGQDPLIQQALISVSDKTGLEELAAGLIAASVRIYSTGGTARFLTERGIPVVDVASYTGFPEMMDGRVKTLHPKIFAGILCRHDREDDQASLDEHGIVTFPLVVVNLYPFQETIQRPDVTESAAVEQIDIGGPSLVRAAAKNHRFTTICTSPQQYPAVLRQIQAGGTTTLGLRRRLMAAAFAHTASYDQAIAEYFAGSEEAGGSAEQGGPDSGLDLDLGQATPSGSVAAHFPEKLQLAWRKQAELRYGENPHQAAAVYGLIGPTAAGQPSIVSARQLHGKELSYNNILDLDAALQMVRLLPDPAVVVLKHNNPCGAATDPVLATALQRAMEGDPVSAFGSILGFNRPLDLDSGRYLGTPGLFVEAIVAPDFSPEAVEYLTTQPKWKANVRLLAVGSLQSPRPEAWIRQISGGLLVQDSDTQCLDPASWQNVTKTAVDDGLWDELRFAWAMVRQVKSNAITLSKERALVGVGAGQMSRVDSVKIAIDKAGSRAAGSILASDAFFPFPDSVHQAAAAGVRVLIQPGGSRRDDEVIAACDQHGLPMLFTGQRHFKH